MYKPKFLLTIILFAISGSACWAQLNTIALPNGWTLSPVGKQLGLGDLPLNIVVSPNKAFAAVTNNGQGAQSIQLIDVKADRVIDSIDIDKSWYGLVFSPDNKSLYVSGGNDNRIFKYAIQSNKLILTDSIILGEKWPLKISPTGMCINAKSNTMYVVTKENNSLYEIDLATKKFNIYNLGSEAYTCVLRPDNQFLYVSLWGSDQLLVWNTITKKIVMTMAIGDNPNELILTKNGKYLYVANANDNSVAVVNTNTLKIEEVLNTALYPNAPNGSTTNGLALNEKENRLYVANADNNYLAVFDVEKKGSSTSIGFVPVGWYPTSVKVIHDKVYVTNGKGLSSRANPNGPNPLGKKQAVIYQSGDLQHKSSPVEYIGSLFKGSLSIFTEPTTTKLGQYTKQVYANTPYTKDKELVANGAKGNPIPKKMGEVSPIKYVFYVIKENRTYDQILGDVPKGNGDTSLVLFGNRITPNQHALVNQFVLLDNFYVDAEVSADGHNWSTAAYGNDYTEKTWPSNYSGRGGSYDYEGQKKIAYPKGGFIWDHALKANVSFRTYGEFADNHKANYPTVANKFCKAFTGFDSRVADTTRFQQWKKDFDSLLAIHQLPQLSTIRFPNDHTEGTKLGRPTPFAHMADNDYAVGLFVEYLSKSPIWEQTAIFILEDDAQNGADHVDAHRSTAYVAGGFVKRNYVDHTMYSTSSMLRTIELILGIPPMSQYDAAAEPMWRSFSSKYDATPFHAMVPNVDLKSINVKADKLAMLSGRMDFSKEDNVPDLLFNELLWKAIKGENKPMPAPRRSAFIKVVDAD
jgi:YVTN family beta-propeller protein